MESSVVTDVVYGRKFGLALTLDIARPVRPSGVGVLGLSSGGWQSWPEAGKPDPQEFLRLGQTFITVMHGGRPRFTIPEMVADIRRALRFVRFHAAEWGVDPDRLGLFGISSGGNLSLLTAAQANGGDKGAGPGVNPGAADPVDLQSDRVGAVACFYPPTDFANFGAPGKVWLPFPKAGGDLDDSTAARLISPVTHFNSGMPPTFIIHGDADELVPYQQAQQAATHLRRLGIEHHLETRPGKGHGWPEMGAEHALCAQWLDEHLRHRS